MTVNGGPLWVRADMPVARWLLPKRAICFFFFHEDNQPP